MTEKMAHLPQNASYSHKESKQTRSTSADSGRRGNSMDMLIFVAGAITGTAISCAVFHLETIRLRRNREDRG